MENITEDIWLNFGNKLKSFIKSKVQNETIAEDILQETFIKIHSNIDKLEDNTKIQAWVYQITRNVIADHFRKTKKTIDKSPDFLTDDEEYAEEFMTESIRDMVEMMDNLPPEYCEALCLTELDGMSQKDYALKSGISYTAAKSRVQRARRKLKDMLMKCCHYQFDKYGTVIGIYPVNCCCCHG